jgi:phosphohistidine phosphatase
MKTLLIVRHGEAERGADDRERPLLPSGRAESADLGQRLRRKGLVPDLVLCSPARRAQETWREIEAALGRSIETRLDGRLYPGEPGEVLAAVAGVPNAVGTLMIVGHNPGLHALARRLATRGDGALLARLASGLATGTGVELAFDARRWTRLGGGALMKLFTPRASAETA